MDKFQKGGEMYEMLGDFYNLNKSLLLANLDTDEDWSWCVNIVDEFTKKHTSRYAKELALTLLEELENRYKERKEANNASRAA